MNRVYRRLLGAAMVALTSIGKMRGQLDSRLVSSVHVTRRVRLAKVFGRLSIAH